MLSKEVEKKVNEIRFKRLKSRLNRIKSEVRLENANRERVRSSMTASERVRFNRIKANLRRQDAIARFNRIKANLRRQDATTSSMTASERVRFNRIKANLRRQDAIARLQKLHQRRNELASIKNTKSNEDESKALNLLAKFKNKNKYSI